MYANFFVNIIILIYLLEHVYINKKKYFLFIYLSLYFIVNSYSTFEKIR